MKYGCGVVLYFPTSTQISDVIRKKNVFDLLLVFDNTPYNTTKEAKEVERKFLNAEIVYIGNGKNRGLSIAYNIMCKIAIEREYDYLLILDQDSLFSEIDIKSMFTFIDEFKHSERIGMFVPTIQYQHDNNISEKKEGYEQVEWAISSGSFLNLNVYKMTEGFDEFLFIDRVDYDYCKLLEKMNYSIIKVNYVFLKQELGETKYVFGRKISEHSAIRIYYMSRNRWYISYKHNIFPKKIMLPLLGTIKQFFMIVIYQKNKFEKIRCLNKGFKDFLFYKKGSDKL